VELGKQLAPPIRAELNPARVIGERLLARDIVGEIRELLGQGATDEPAIARALAAFDMLASVAREPRKIRQIRLGNSIRPGNSIRSEKQE
ncbi:MAG: hypothetical protein Q8L13_08700, partial [Bradyrhizobium sp.]|nr:hypothetical protein [Bradyrhizobium sp.]